MSSALSWLHAKMSGPSGSGGLRATATSTPASQRIDRDQAKRANQMARWPVRRTSISGRLTRKKNSIERLVYASTSQPRRRATMTPSRDAAQERRTPGL